MTNLTDELIAEVKSFQEWAKGDRLSPQLRWFATLELENATVEGDWISFIWRDPADNTRHGWRWEIAPDRLYLLEAHLHEDLETTEKLTEPDKNGVRWWGIHLYT